MYRVRRDGSGLECLYQHGNDEFVVHETFLGDSGDLVFTVWPRALRRLSWSSGEISTIVELNAWHLSPNRAGTRIVCDTNHPDRGLLSIDAATGATRVICHPGSSNGGSQWATSRYALAEDFARAARTAQEGASAKQALSWMESPTDTVYGPQWSHPTPPSVRRNATSATPPTPAAFPRCTSPNCNAVANGSSSSPGSGPPWWRFFNPHGLSDQGLGKAIPAGEPVVPATLVEDRYLCRYRKILCPAVPARVAVHQHQQVEIAADAPVAPSVGTEVADGAHVR